MSKGFNSVLLGLLAMGIAGHSSLFREPEKDCLEGIDIDKEIELIRKKRSGLSKRLRDTVEWRYKQKHKQDAQ